AAVKQLGREGFPMVGGRVDESRIVASLPNVEFLGVLRAEQQRLASKVIENDDRGPIEIIAGVDVSYRGDEMYAAAASVALAGRVPPTSEKHEDALPVLIDGVTRGYAWTPPNRSRAIYVSVGHRISLLHAMDLVRKTTRDRYPEALRIADRISRNMKGNEKREKGAAR